MRVRAPSSHEYGADVRVGGEVGGEGEAHGGVAVPVQGELVGGGGGGDEGFDEGEGVRGRDVDAGQEGGEVWVRGEEGEVED